MKILLPNHIVRKLETVIVNEKKHETGGILMAQRIDYSSYRVVDASVQKKPGSYTSFERDPEQARIELAKFYAQTQHNYRHFNYLGEWHSHPSFATVPSLCDIWTMKSLVEDMSFGANFAVLLIVRLNHQAEFVASAHTFVPGHMPFEAEIVMEGKIN
jgi:proteasome lid subunit RPN8/RPN11